MVDSNCTVERKIPKIFLATAALLEKVHSFPGDNLEGATLSHLDVSALVCLLNNQWCYLFIFVTLGYLIC